MPSPLTASTRPLSAAALSRRFARLRGALARHAAAALLLGASLLAGAGMTLAVDRLESAARTRASLERQTAALQERLIPADPAAPALQQVREDYDRAIAQAADLARGSIWAGLCLMLGGMGWMERRRRPTEASRLAGPTLDRGIAAGAAMVSGADGGQPQCSVTAQPLQAPERIEPAAAALSPAPRDRNERRERLGDIAREMRALRDWIGADPQGDAPAPQHRHQQAAVRSVRFHLAA